MHLISLLSTKGTAILASNEYLLEFLTVDTLSYIWLHLKGNMNNITLRID